jgi:hypothetical protein
MRIANTQTNYFYGDTVFQGGLSALSGTTFTNTIFATTTALSINNTGEGPALYVSQASGPYDVASFYDGDGIEVLHVGNAQGGGNPLGQVGINTSDPSAELTVNGAISSNGVITVAGGTSDQWNTAYAFTTNIPLVTAFKVPNISLGTQGNYTPQGFYTIPTGRMFVVTSLSVLFDTGQYVNGGTPVNTRVVVNSGTVAASFATPQLQIAASTTFAANSLRKTSWTGSDTFLYAVAGDTLHFRVAQAGTAYTATALVEGVLM